MRIAIVIATVGRAAVLKDTWRHWLMQTRPADRIVVSSVREEDVPEEIRTSPDVEVRLGPPGLTVQRNRGLDAVDGDCDIAVFFDDDFVPATTFLAELERLFTARPDAVMATGAVLADGVTRGGITYVQARDIVAAAEQQPQPGELRATPVRSAYGCNMAVRLLPARERFDEHLPLYGWLEDVDFSYRMAAHGVILRCENLRGVHMGVTSGRLPGKRAGYSQIVNPYYCWRKGSFTIRDLLGKPLQNIAANTVKSFAAEPWIDRRGRLIGNITGLWDIVRGRAHPARIMEF